MGKCSFGSMAGAWSRAEAKLNRSVADSAIGRYFKLDSRKSSFTKELRAGTTTFLTMVYIISVNSAILVDSGGPCKPNDADDAGSYDRCLAEARSDYVVATGITAMAGCLAMGLFANLPLALAPAMGTNAYFTYSMVGFHGSGSLDYETALAVVMLEGCIFLLICAVGLRARLARLIPRCIRLSSGAGIGMFLAFTGLQAHEGLGLVGADNASLVTLAACRDVDPATGSCLGGTMRSPTFWLGAAGFAITAMCLKRGVKGSMIYGIVLVTLVSWIRGTSVTIFPDTPVGDSGFGYFKKVVDFHLIRSTAGRMRFARFFARPVWVPLATLLYVDVLNTTGAMYSMAEYGGFTDDKGGFEGEYPAFLVDAGTTILSSAVGTTMASPFLESTAGMREGGRTGMTAVAAAVWFAAALFFSPLLTNVPPWAVGPSLVMIGVMMMTMVRDVDWSDMKEAVPAFVTMMLMPLSYSIANGIIAGVVVYVAMNLDELVVWAWEWTRRKRRGENGASTAAAGAQVPAPPPPPPPDV